MGNISDTKLFIDEQEHLDDSEYREYAEPDDENKIVADDRNVEKILYSYQFIEKLLEDSRSVKRLVLSFMITK